MKPDNAAQRISTVIRITKESQDIVIHMDNPELLDHVIHMVLLDHVIRMVPLDHVIRMVLLVHATPMEEHQDPEIPMGLQIREALDLDIPSLQPKKTRSSLRGKSCILWFKNGGWKIHWRNCLIFLIKTTWTYYRSRGSYTSPGFTPGGSYKDTAFARGREQRLSSKEQEAHKAAKPGDRTSATSPFTRASFGTTFGKDTSEIHDISGDGRTITTVTTRTITCEFVSLFYWSNSWF